MQRSVLPIEPVATIRRLTAGDMKKISALIYDKSGIALRDNKRALVIARLQGRVRDGGFRSFTDYLNYLEYDDSGAEFAAVLDAIATNHTSFFREAAHFHFLANLVAAAGTSGLAMRPLTGWSAACSTGEEAYSIAATVLDRLPAAEHDRLQLLASDLSTSAIRIAARGIYPFERVAEIPRVTLQRYFERGIGSQEGLVRVKVEVRRLLDCRRLNLIEIQNLGVTFDFIFCRNAMIYFDRDSRQRAVSMLERHLKPDGYLFVSHSEGLIGINHHLQWCTPGVYRRRAA